MQCGDGTPWGDWLGAWDLWWTGEEAKQCLLLGSKILWWGRAGKVAQLIAGMAIVVEILGPEWFVRRGTGIEKRTQKYVKDAEIVYPRRLRKIYDFATTPLTSSDIDFPVPFFGMIAEFIVLSFNTILVFLMDFLYKTATDPAYHEYQKYYYIVLTSAVGMNIIAWSIIYLFYLYDINVIIVVFLCMIGCVFLYLGILIFYPLLSIAMLKLSIAILRSLRSAIVMPISGFLMDQRLVRRARILSLTLLISGFQFDFLTS